eukprot:gene3592-4114_t
MSTKKSSLASGKKLKVECARKEVGGEVLAKSIGNGIKGLSNLGNTCFFNSIMQNLTHVLSLRDSLLVTPGSDNGLVRSTGSLTMEMHYFFTKMYRSSANVVTPSSLFSEISKKSPRFQGYKQQDAHELLRYLLDGLINEEQAAVKNRRDPTYIDNIFGGRLISVITCFHCGYVSKTYEPFLDLSLPLPSGAGVDVRLKNIIMPRIINRVTRPYDSLPKYDSDDEEEEKEESKKKGPRTMSKNQLKKQRKREGVASIIEVALSPLVEGESMDITPLLDDVVDPIIAKQEVSETLVEPATPAVVEIIETVDIALVTSPDGADALGASGCEMEVFVANNGAEKKVSTPSPTPSPSPSEPSSPIMSPMSEGSAVADNLRNSASDFVMLESQTYHKEQQLATYSLIENYETEQVVTPALSTTSDSPIEEFEKLDISGGGIGQKKQEEDKKEEEKKDLQTEPIDLRQNIPDEARKLDNLLACLMQFTNPEKLEGDNGFICSHCAKPNKKQESPPVVPAEEESPKDLSESVESFTLMGEIKKEELEGEDRKKENGDAVVAEAAAADEEEKKETSSSSLPVVAEDSKPTPKKAKKKKAQPVKRVAREEEEVIKRNASKQYLLSNTPPYLTVQLKRFMQTKNGFQKNGKLISYPYSLDLTAFTDQSVDATNSNQPPQLHKYTLNGVVEHMGGLGSGHYVAHVYDDQAQQWYYISDSGVRLSSLSQVLTNEAYLLFYKKDILVVDAEELLDYAMKINEFVDVHTTPLPFLKMTQIKIASSKEKDSIGW